MDLMRDRMKSSASAGEARDRGIPFDPPSAINYRSIEPRIFHEGWSDIRGVGDLFADH